MCDAILRKIRNILLIINITLLILSLSLISFNNRKISRKLIANEAIRMFGVDNIISIEKLENNNVILLISNKFNGNIDYNSILDEYISRIDDYKPNTRLKKIILKLVDYKENVEVEYIIKPLEFY